MNRTYIALILLTGCNTAKTEADQSAYDEGFAEGYQAAEDALNANYADLADQVATLQTSLATLQTSDATQDGRLEGIEADYLTSSDVADVVRLITADTTIAVGPTREFAEVADALASLDGYAIASNATVTIQIDDGDYYPTEPIEIRHPDGASIHIIGNEAAPSSVSFFFTGTDGFVVRDGHILGLLSGVAAYGDEDSGRGIAILNGSLMTVGSALLDGFQTAGVSVESGSVLIASDDIVERGYPAGWLSASNSGDGYGFHVFGGSYSDLNGTVASGNGNIGFLVRNGSGAEATGAQATLNGGAGFESYIDSYLYAPGAISDSNSNDGFRANYQSMMIAQSSTALNNAIDGYSAQEGSYLYVSSATASDNGAVGFEAAVGSTLNASGSTSTGNTTYGYLANIESALVADVGISVDNGTVGYESISGSFVRAYQSNASGNGTAAYGQDANGVIYATGATGDTTTDSHENDADFIIGL